MSIWGIVIIAYLCVSALLGVAGWLIAAATGGWESPSLILKVAVFWPVLFVLWVLGVDRSK